MSGKVAIVTGASSGIGRATALLLAQRSYTVYGLARRADRLAELEAQGVKPLQADVTDDAALRRAVDEVMQREGRIDVLINNAGYGEYGAVEDVAPENARQQLDVNLFGLARITQLVLPQMRRQQCGKIVNISSIGGKMATPMGGWYHASKFAVEGLSDSLRMEVKQFGIDVIVVEPGGIQSEWGDIAMGAMLAASQHSAYAGFAQAAKKTTDAQATKSKAPDPIIIARLIKKAIEARHPKARYAAGFMARPILFLRKILSDAAFDKIILSQFK